MKFWLILQYGWTLKTVAKWNKPCTKHHILFALIDVKCPEWENLYRQKVNWCLLKVGVGTGDKEVIAKGYKVSLWGDKNILKFTIVPVAHTCKSIETI